MCITPLYAVLPGTQNQEGFFTMRILPSGTTNSVTGGLEVASRHLEELQQWQASIKEAMINLEKAQQQMDQQVKKLHIAKEMSDLIHYCRAVPFEMESECMWKYHSCRILKDTKQSPYAPININSQSLPPGE